MKISLKLFLIMFIAGAVACSACARKAPRDISTPEKTLETLLTAMYFKDADAFLYCMTDEQLISYGKSRQEEEGRLREAMKQPRGNGHLAHEFEITKRLVSKGRVRIEYQLKKKFFTKADETGWKGAHLFIRKPEGWKSYGVDVFRFGQWRYTKEDPFTPQY
ncbi:MAG: hypothetical protein HZC17_01520 [Candidatus Omnitrophica bacterium]|nr:hypothetical protein [Candidatus Omnitrophota bacterium]